MSKGASKLTIQETTHGVSVDGIEDVLKKIKKVLTVDLKNSIKDYDNMLSVIKENWVGEDCNKWCESFATMANEMANSLDSYYSQIEAEFNKIFKEWEEFQASNVRPGK